MNESRPSPKLIRQELGDLPWMSLEQGIRLTDFVRLEQLERNQPKRFTEHRDVLFKVNA